LAGGGVRIRLLAELQHLGGRPLTGIPDSFHECEEFVGLESDKLLRQNRSRNKCESVIKETVKSSFPRANRGEMAVKFNMIHKKWGGFAFSSLFGLLSPTGC
jgi:hypothetical protein